MDTDSVIEDSRLRGNDGAVVKNGGVVVKNGGIAVRNDGVVVRNSDIVVRNYCEVVEYALSGMQTSLGVTKYQLTQSLPDEFKSSLPSVESIETEREGGL